jgi:ribonuclease VapC
VIVDASALAAVLFFEPDAYVYAEAIERAASTRVSAATLLELAIVVDGSGNSGAVTKLEQFLEAATITVEPVTLEHAQIARQAYREYGRGSGHAARLNFGDCFAYALAKASGEPLLFKGQDFARTDVRSALPSDGST